MNYFFGLNNKTVFPDGFLFANGDLIEKSV
jgi:hypothetical protein